MMYILFSFCTYVVMVTSQVVTVGKKCPNVTTVKPFIIDKYIGDWYEIVKFKSSFEEGQRCNTAQYTLKPNGHITIENTGYANGKKVTATADGYAQNPNEPGRLSVKFNALAPYAPYWILDTDYQTYSLVYSCENIVVGKIEFAWILSRKRTLEEDQKDHLYKDLDNYGVVTDNFMTEDQSNCPELD